MKITKKQIITLEKISYEKNNHFINYALADSDSIFSGVGDGYVYIEENTDHWEDVHDASSGDSAPDTETSASVVSREHEVLLDIIYLEVLYLLLLI